MQTVFFFITVLCVSNSCLAFRCFDRDFNPFPWKMSIFRRLNLKTRVEKTTCATASEIILAVSSHVMFSQNVDIHDRSIKRTTSEISRFFLSRQRSCTFVKKLKKIDVFFFFFDGRGFPGKVACCAYGISTIWLVGETNPPLLVIYHQGYSPGSNPYKL